MKEFINWTNTRNYWIKEFINWTIDRNYWMKGFGVEDKIKDSQQVLIVSD